MSTAFAPHGVQLEVKRKLVRMCVRILRPLVRMLLRYGMSCQEFSEITRWVYVDVAMRDRDFALKSRSKQFKSRAAVITGLSRKEVLRLTEFTSPEDLEDIAPYNRAARVLTGWTENALFCSTKDEPKVLPIKGGPGSFHDLVRLYSGDVPPRAVLDELRRCGAVEIIDGDSVKLKRFAYFPENGSGEEIEVVEFCAGHLMETLDHNTQPGVREKFLQRAAFSSHLADEDIAEIRAHVREQAEALSRKVHHYVSGREEKPAKSGKAYRQAGLGLFWFESENKQVTSDK